MDTRSRWRDRLAGPTCEIQGSGRAIIAASGMAILLIAQWDEPGSMAELLALSPALFAFVIRGWVPRLYPELFAAAVIVPVSLVVANAGHLEGAFFLSTLVTQYTAWHLGTTPRSVAILAVATPAPWFVALHLGGTDSIGWPAWSAACVFTFGLGLGLRAQQKVILELEAAREALAEQAVAEERRRIARELHDLAGHTLAAVLLHVTGARHVLRRDLDEAERALLDAETIGRASLDQIRATVAALRTDERGTDPSLAGSADLVGLVDEYRRAGLVVSLDLAPAASAIEGPAGTALHRITREALANVARHAASNRVRVAVTLSDGEVHLCVSDHGQPATRPDPAAGHFGLIGMRERARALGGELEAGPTEDGWCVSARLRTSAPHDELLPS